MKNEETYWRRINLCSLLRIHIILLSACTSLWIVFELRVRPKQIHQFTFNIRSRRNVIFFTLDISVRFEVRIETKHVEPQEKIKKNKIHPKTINIYDSHVFVIRKANFMDNEIKNLNFNIKKLCEN